MLVSDNIAWAFETWWLGGLVATCCGYFLAAACRAGRKSSLRRACIIRAATVTQGNVHQISAHPLPGYTLPPAWPADAIPCLQPLVPAGARG
ncbi:hypothetical protein V8C86DRAFT_717167 [Haematococcus lacustris]